MAYSQLPTKVDGDTFTEAMWTNIKDNFDALVTTTLNSQTGTTYTPSLTDANNKFVMLNNASAITVTIPTNASVAFPVGSVINFIQVGAGQVTISGDTGVTVNSQGSKNKLFGQSAVGSVVKTATDTWYLYGNLSA
jgi:hypothetical protein